MKTKPPECCLTVEEAREKCVCRICQKPIVISKGMPDAWQTMYKVRVFPHPNIVLNFGAEFAHEECLKKEQYDASLPQAQDK